LHRLLVITCVTCSDVQRLQETAYDLKGSNASGMQYCMSGVGGDPQCVLQVPLDALTFAEVQNVEQFAQEMPYNAVTLQLSRFGSVSQAVEVIRKARGVKWPVVLVSNNTEETGPESTDAFLADFAVGAGAGQFMMGGVFTAECAAKYNRMTEISEESPGIRYVGGKFRSK
jgi:enolase